MTDTLHSNFLKGLKAVEGSDVHLVSGLADNRIAYPDQDEIIVFIPDLHLVSKDIAAQYRYSTNRIELLTRVIGYIDTFKKEQTEKGKKVSVFQIGDIMDLWREGDLLWSAADLTKWGAAVQKVYEDRFSILSPMLKSIQVRMLLGNHDSNLNKLPRFQRARFSHYFPELDGPFVAMHGHLFSAFEMKFPDVFKRLGIKSIFGKKARSGTTDLDEITTKFTKTKPYEDEIIKDHLVDPNIGEMKSDVLAEREAQEGNGETWEYNVARRKADDDAKDKRFRFLEPAKVFFNNDLNLNIRLVFIGHTHHARIAIDETDGFFALADFGAWTGNCKAKVDGGDEKVMPNTQIGALANNEIRIYQMAT